MAKVLLVDDDADVCAGLVFLCTSLGLEVITAKDGAEAHSILLADKDVGLLISDSDMGENKMNGAELLKVLREDLNLGLPVIIYTGRETLSIRETCAIHSAVLIVKPGDLTGAIKNALGM